MTELFDLPFEEDAEAPPEPSPVEPAAPVRRVLSVTELTVAIRDALEERFFQVWVEGELSNCKQWNGHLYFTLKDRKSTRLNSSHRCISYAVFCLKKKKN